MIEKPADKAIDWPWWTVSGYQSADALPLPAQPAGQLSKHMRLNTYHLIINNQVNLWPVRILARIFLPPPAGSPASLAPYLHLMYGHVGLIS